MQKAAKEKVFLMIFAIASVLFLCAPSTASSTPTPGLENRVELFLLGGENRTEPQAFESANRVENYDSRWGVALESPVAPNSGQAAIRQRVLANIAESRASREASNFGGGLSTQSAKLSNKNALRLLSGRARAAGLSPQDALVRARGVVDSFGGPITTRHGLAGEVFEVFGDASASRVPSGIFVTRGLAGSTSSLQRQILLALPNSQGARNSAIRVGTGTLTRNQILLEGTVGGQQGGIFGSRFLPGGAAQSVTDGGRFTGAVRIDF